MVLDTNKVLAVLTAMTDGVLSKQRGLFCRSMKESKKLMADVMAKLQERQPILILSFHDESEKSCRSITSD